VDMTRKKIFRFIDDTWTFWGMSAFAVFFVYLGVVANE